MLKSARGFCSRNLHKRIQSRIECDSTDDCDFSRKHIHLGSENEWCDDAFVRFIFASWLQVACQAYECIDSTVCVFLMIWPVFHGSHVGSAALAPSYTHVALLVLASLLLVVMRRPFLPLALPKAEKKRFGRGEEGFVDRRHKTKPSARTR